MPYGEPMGAAEVAEILGYDAETGRLWWKSKVARKIMIGMEAGSVKTTRRNADGTPVCYRYVKLGDTTVPAARIAWLLHYGDWPRGKLGFVDGDTLNLRIANLEALDSVVVPFDHTTAEGRAAYRAEHHQTFPMSWKERHLQDKFDISLAHYGKMLVEQGGCCAICKCEETATRNGVVKALAVDHDHATGKVRGLLCSDCNQAIGKLKENRESLLEAVRYLDKHSAPKVEKDPE